MNVSFSAANPIAVIRRPNAADKKQPQKSQAQNASAQSGRTKENLKVFAPLVLAAALMAGGCGGSKGAVGGGSKQETAYDYSTGYAAPDADKDGIITQKEAGITFEYGKAVNEDISNKLETGEYESVVYDDGTVGVQNQAGEIVGRIDTDGIRYSIENNENGQKALVYTDDVNAPEKPAKVQTFDYNDLGELSKITTITETKGGNVSFDIKVEE